MNRKLKILFVILAIPVVLLVAGVIALKLYLTEERIKSLIIPQIEQATNRTVSVGDASLVIVPTIGLTLDSVKLSNPRGMTFDRDDFLAVDRLTLDVKLWPLLGSRVEINTIILERPRLYLERRKDGRKNFASPTEPAAVSSPQKQGEVGMVGSLLLANLELRNGEIEFVNKKFDSRMIIRGLDQQLSAENRPGTSLLTARTLGSIRQFSYGSLSTWYISGLPLTSMAHLTVDAGSMLLTIDSSTVQLKDLPFTLEGTIAMGGEDPDLDLTIRTPQVQLTQLLSLVPAAMLKAAEGMSSSGDVRCVVRVRGISGDVMSPGVEGSFSVSNGTIRYVSLPKAITGIQLSGMFEKPAAPIEKTGIGTFSLDRIAAQAGGNVLNGSLRVVNFDDPALTARFTASMNLAEAGDFYPLEKGTELNGTMKADLSVEGRAKVQSSLRARGTIDFRDVTIATAGIPNPVRGLNGIITFDNQLIESKHIAMTIGESDLTLGFSLRNYLSILMSTEERTEKPSVSVTLTSKQVRTVDLMTEESAEGKTGRKTTDASSSAQTGMLPGIDIDASVSIDRLVTEKFEFRNARGSVTIREGVVTLKSFTINAFEGTITTMGTLDLRDPKKRPFNLDLDMRDVQSNTMLSKFSSFGNNLFGRITMKTKLKGELDDTLGLDRGSLLGSGNVRLSDGKLLGFPLTARLADFTGVQQLREVSFTDWSNAFSIDAGRMKISDLKVKAGGTDFLMGGSHGLDGSMDYALNVKLPGSASDQIKLQGIANDLLQFFKDKEGRINLNFVVGGMTASPTLKLDTRAQEEMAKQALEQKKQQLIDEGKKKVQDELKKKAEEGLKKLFKRP